MTQMADARLPVVFAPATTAGAGDALLLDAGVPDDGAAAVVARLAPSRGHVLGCACCLPRGVAAEALGLLFLRRARGEVPFFRRVVASVADPAAVRAAVHGDRLVAARFRLDSGGTTI